MGCAVPAQCGLSFRPRGGEADPGSGALRLQLALRDRDGMLPGGDCVWTSAGAGTDAVDENLLANTGANAAGDDCDFVHAGPGIRDALLGSGCGAGPGVYAHWMVISILRDILRMAGSGVNGERYVGECSVRQPATDHFATAGN